MITLSLAAIALSRGDVMGGSFTASQGGRQVTPIPGETEEPMPGDAQEPLVPPAPRQSPEQSERVKTGPT